MVKIHYLFYFIVSYIVIVEGFAMIDLNWTLWLIEIELYVVSCWLKLRLKVKFKLKFEIELYVVSCWLKLRLKVKFKLKFEIDIDVEIETEIVDECKIEVEIEIWN
jgi:hypothetical protein